MDFELIKKLNWADLVVLLIIIRTLYIGQSRGFIVEIFKLLGLLTSIVISFHYYSRIADFLNARSPLPLDFADFISLLFLSTIIVLAFKFIRDGVLIFIKTEAKPALDKWAGFALSFLRAYMLSSLVLIVVFLSGLTYFQNSVKDSYSQGFLLNAAPRIYSGCFENLIVKFFPGEQLNTAIFDALESKNKK